jgi:hypothetical protein
MISTSDRKSVSCGIFAVVTSVLDWYLNAAVRNPALTEQEQFIFEHYLEMPHRPLAPPGMSPLGVAYLFGHMGGVFFLGFMIWRSLERARVDFREAPSPYLKLAQITAHLVGVGAAGLFYSADFMLPAVMRLYFAATLGIVFSAFLELILGLPYHLFNRRK